MKLSPLVLASCCLLVLGCREADPSNASQDLMQENAAVAPEAAAETLVSDFAAADLRGLAVRDHPQGVQVVRVPPALAARSYPAADPPLWATEGAVLNAVNGTTLRGAAHFRDLINAATETGDIEDVDIGMLLFLEDAGDGWGRIKVQPPATGSNVAEGRER